MEEFMRKLNGKRARVTLEHCLFDRQAFYCDKLQTVNDDKRIGLVLKEHEIFVYKQDVKVAESHNNTYVLSDGRLTITINLQKM